MKHVFHSQYTFPVCINEFDIITKWSDIMELLYQECIFLTWINHMFNNQHSCPKMYQSLSKSSIVATNWTNLPYSEGHAFKYSLMYIYFRYNTVSCYKCYSKMKLSSLWDNETKVSKCSTTFMLCIHFLTVTPQFLLTMKFIYEVLTSIYMQLLNWIFITS